MFESCCRSILFFAVTTYSASAYCASEEQDSDIPLGIVAQSLPAWLAESGTPAAGVAYIETGKLQWVTVAGEQSEGVEATTDTLFNVASLAKPITAEVVLQLIKDGVLGAGDSALNYWVDEDIKGHKWLDDLTIHHLLSHQSGFPNWRAQTDNRLTFQFQPGTRSGYSGEGYEYLVKIIQNKTQQPFATTVRERVVVPAGMSSAIWSPNSDYDAYIAHPKGPKGKYGVPSKNLSGADDLYITISDYGHFTAFVMNQYILAEEKHHNRWQISHDLRAQLCHPERLKQPHCPEKVGFAQGWSVFHYADDSLYIQGGGDWGERSLVVLSPEQQKAVVVMTNGASGMRVVRKVMATLLAHPHLDAFIEMQGG